MNRSKPAQAPRGREPRTNDQIRIPQVRLVDEDGTQIGITDTDEAREMASSKSLDLVEVAPDATPPVVRIMDYGKFKYDQARKQKRANAKQKQAELKTIRLRPNVADHDYEFKVKHARQFLERGDKVRLLVIFRGRENVHRELGAKLLERAQADLEDIAQVETPIRQEGRDFVLNMMLKK
jgi:translation initiation factor IF-3